MSKVCPIVAVYFILVSHLGFAVEYVGPYERARRYLDADLAIVGDVLSCTTRTVQEEDTLGQNGWMYHHATLMDVYGVRVDSVLKGSFADSMIVIQSKLFGGSTRRSKLSEVNEKGDSLYLAEITDGFDGGGADRIRKLGRYLILLQKQDTTYTSMFCSPYSKYIIDFFDEVEKEGEDYLRRLQPPK